MVAVAVHSSCVSLWCLREPTLLCNRRRGLSSQRCERGKRAEGGNGSLIPIRVLCQGFATPRNHSLFVPCFYYFDTDFSPLLYFLSLPFFQVHLSGPGAIFGLSNLFQNGGFCSNSFANSLWELVLTIGFILPEWYRWFFSLFFKYTFLVQVQLLVCELFAKWRIFLQIVCWNLTWFNDWFYFSWVVSLVAWHSNEFSIFIALFTEVRQRQQRQSRTNSRFGTMETVLK